MTYVISKEIEFDAGHRVPLHDSKCRSPHGHRYKVVAQLAGQLITEGPQSGMVRDFGHVKTAMMRHIHSVYDHSFIISADDDPLLEMMNGDYGWKINIVPFHPTAECLAKHFLDILLEDIPELVAVIVLETPTSSAMYIREVPDESE